MENNFKFGLYLKGEKIFERIFSADLYNPVVRYSVDIRDRIPSIINDIQQVLQKQSANLDFESIQNVNQSKTSKDYRENTKKYYKYICKINKMSPVKLFVPSFFNQETQKFMIPIKGTEFKFGVYINQNPIVERNFYVENYNPEARFSNELAVVLNDIVDYLKSYLKKSDVNHMWNDYDLITTYELNIQQVRELSKDRREEYLKRKSDLGFVEKVRLDSNKNSEYAM